MDEPNQKKMMECSYEVLEPIYNGATRNSPKSIFINSGSAEDIAYIRKMALEKNTRTSDAQEGIVSPDAWRRAAGRGR